MEHLRTFYNDTGLRESVKQSMVEYISEYGIKKMFDREDVSAVPEAKEIVEKFFDKLEEEFGKKEVVTPISPR